MIKCLIIDDEPLAIEIIENYLNNFDDITIVDTCKNALQAFKILETTDIDLLFLDIQMPQLTGIDFLKTLKNPPKAIVTSAYLEYAIEGYELDIVDYLVKPISFNRFVKSISKFKAQHNLKRTHSTHTNSDEKEYVYVRENKKNHKVQISDILYLESVKDYIRVHTKNKKLIIKSTLSDFLVELPKAHFLRVHRSYAINVNYVTAFTSKDIEIDKVEIPIGVSYKQVVFNSLK